MLKYESGDVISCFIFALFRKPEDWTLSWGGAGTIYGWGHNHRGQLGGVDGAKVKLPTPCETLSVLRPVQVCRFINFNQTFETFKSQNSLLMF